MKTSGLTAERERERGTKNGLPPFVSFQQSLNNTYRQRKRHSGGTKLANAVVLCDTYADVNKLFDFHKENIFTSNTTWKPSVEKKSTYLAC